MSSKSVKKIAENPSSLWFLIKALQKKTTNGKSVIEIEYFLVHSKDLIYSDSSNTHAEGFVRFIKSQRILEGKVVASSEDRPSLEQTMKRLVSTATLTNVMISGTKFLLVQFSKGSNDIIHAIVPEKHVCRPMGTRSNQREVIVYDGQKRRVATVLHVHTNKTVLMSEFQKLKSLCFEMGFDEEDNDITIADNAWILVLYTCGPYNIVYTVLNHRDTYWKKGNQYKDVVTYLTDGNQVYQAIIIRKSNDVNELHNKLDKLKSACLNMQFPLKINNDIESAAILPPPNFQSKCGTTETFERFAGEGNPYAEIEPSLHALENRMREEAATLLESIDVLQNAKRTLEQRKAILPKNATK